ncbi:MAG: hypothetical protein PHX14_09170 [Syntrophomonadaceae bacterium]|nr:hypothetical protein [Syntrophomonadaceae bacterium]
MLIPSEGSREAAEMWRQYRNLFPGESLFAASSQMIWMLIPGKLRQSKGQAVDKNELCAAMNVLDDTVYL